MDTLVHPDQAGFIKGRSISDHIRTIDDTIALAKNIKYQVL